MIDVPQSGGLETTDLFVEEVFVKQRTPDAPPELSAAARRVLGLQGPVLPSPEDSVRDMMSLPEQAATQTMTQGAEGIHRAEPIRAAKLRLCNAGLSGLRKSMILAEEIRASAWRDMKGSSVEELDRATSRSKVGLWILPSILAIGIGLSLGVLSMCLCEPINGKVLLDLSGHLEGYPLGVKLALVTIVPMFVFMGTWTLLSLFKPSTSKRTALGILLVSLPVGILTAFLFAMKMSADINPDPFNPEPFPPFWIVVFLFMMCSAGTAVCSKLLIRRVMCRPLGIELTESADLLFHSDRAMRWAIRGQQCESLAAQFQSVIDDIEAERAAFVAQCLAELASARKYVADQVNAAADEARRRVTPIPRCLQTQPHGHSDYPRRNGQTDRDGILAAKPR